MYQKIILQRDIRLDIIRVPFLSPHTPPPFCKQKPKDTKTGLALARLLDKTTLKRTYTWRKREMDNGKCGETVRLILKASAEKYHTYLVVLLFWIKICNRFSQYRRSLKGSDFLSFPPWAFPEGPSRLNPGLIGTLLFQHQFRNFLISRANGTDWRWPDVYFPDKARKIKDTCLASHLFKSPLSCRTHEQLLKRRLWATPSRTPPSQVTRRQPRGSAKAGHCKHPSERDPRVPAQALGDSESVL